MSRKNGGIFGIFWVPLTGGTGGGSTGKAIALYHCVNQQLREAREIEIFPSIHHSYNN
ncbi:MULTISPECIES: hypothetical protein [Limnospira]|uniref:Uncharacterized protein n=1 Tax=Limnospira fusiformis PMC 851.14 TaxID=2219512 RepID=A0ABU9EL63_LIMFS|nr:hypothetical protein [Limnospira maxima]EKD05939.1 hypothetical protein SPLC1_S560220 [Arthrospira platensis C1]MDC0838433.1 hypothetical protein [Limnoraphis robusta]